MKTLKKITIALSLTFTTLTTAQTNYPAVKIGDQEWMTKNLDVSTFRNGDPIPQAKTNQEWSTANKAKKPAWCYYHIGYSEISKYGGDPEKTKKYGKLYNVAAVNDKRGLAPKGWHIPNNDEWKVLSNKASISSLKSKSGWKENNGSNSAGFNMLPGGFRDSGFSSLLENAWFWSSSKGVWDTTNESYGEKFEDNYTIRISYFDDSWSKKDMSFNRPGGGHSVRCVKGEEANVLGIDVRLSKTYECYPNFDGAKVYSEPDTNSIHSDLPNGVNSPLPEGWNISTDYKYTNSMGVFLKVRVYGEWNSGINTEGYILQTEWHFE
jgi:uncharacterized protein (TIGR02145 family)